MYLQSRFHHQKKESIDSFLGFVRDGELPRWPLVLFLELSNVCNIKCAMCPFFSALNPNRHVVLKNFERGFMELEQVKASLDGILPYALKVHAHGHGEPTLHPRFHEFLDYLSSFEVLINFCTNGTSLTEDLCEFLVEKQIFSVMVSFSGSTKSDYENIYIGADFDGVLAGMARLTQIKERKKSIYPHLVVKSIGFQHHIDTLPEFVELMARHGVSVIEISRLTCYGNIRELHGHIAVFRPWKEGKIIDEAKRRARELGVELKTDTFCQEPVESEEAVESARHARIHGNPDTQNRVPLEAFKGLAQQMKAFKRLAQQKKTDGLKSYCASTPIPDALEDTEALRDFCFAKPPKAIVPLCLQPFLSMYFFRDGRASCCCYLQPKISFGNLSKRSAEKIWTGPAFREVQREIRRGKYPMTICGPCLKMKPPPQYDVPSAQVVPYRQWFEERFRTPFYPEITETLKFLTDKANLPGFNESPTSPQSSFSVSGVSAKSVWHFPKLGLADRLARKGDFFDFFAQTFATACFIAGSSYLWFLSLIRTPLFRSQARTCQRSPVPTAKLVLPPRPLRFGGKEMGSDFFYLTRAKWDVQRLTNLCGLSQDSKLLDLGCAAGRLWTGILSVYGGISEYVGIDCFRPCIEWANANLFCESAKASFHFVNVLNERYNVHGEALTSDWKLPLADNYFDVICALSVFTHMRFEDMKIYLKEIRRVLKPNGSALFTAFAEEGGAVEEINPEGFSHGPLHCVRINRQALKDVVEASGLRITAHTDVPIAKGQSFYAVSPA